MIPSFASSERAPSFPRGLGVFGSTGSIGRQTLEIVRLFPERFDVRVLTAGRNAELILDQVREFGPRAVVMADEEAADRVRRELGDPAIEVRGGEEALREAAGRPEVDVMMAAIVGFAGLPPVVEAVRSGKLVALANKETLVAGGALIRRLLGESGSLLVPVDSEHSAVFQCLVGESLEAVERITLTASGGPFRAREEDTFDRITPEEALDHPNWSMGEKITVDSATLMNKGLEVIEARWLFDLAPERIRVLVHPQSVVHSLVEFRDGSIKAELGAPDMKIPIQFALSFPDRWPASHERLDLAEASSLTFEEPDPDRFPCLRLAFEALETGGSAPVALNAANEAAVRLFLREEIAFPRIPALIEETLRRTEANSVDSLEAVRAADARARRTVGELRRSVAD